MGSSEPGGHPQDPIAELIAQGQSLEDQGRFEDALSRYRQAIDRDPGRSISRINAGIAASALGRVQEARQHFEAAIALDGHPAAHLNLANLLLDQADFDGAGQHYRAALEQRPNWREARFGLLCVAFEADRARARAPLEAFLQDHPEDLPARLMLADLLIESDGADVALRSLAGLPDGDAALHLKRAKCLSLLFEHTAARRETRIALRIDPTPDHLMAYAFGSMSDPEADFRSLPGEIAAVLALDTVAAVRPLRVASAGRRLRIGYLSGDYRAHPVANFLYPVLKHHDRSRFEVFGLSNTASPDAVTGQLRALCDHWLDLAALNDDQAAARIRDARLDAVIDFSGWTERHRIGVLRRRVAPVQATAFAVYLTTGLPEVDYRICDVHSDPVGLTESAHSEKLLRIDGPQACYHELRPIPHQVEQPFEKNGYFSYGYFNQASKISLPMLEAWATVLRRVPDSRLHLVGVDNPGSRRRILQHLGASGITPERLRIEGRMGASVYAQRLGSVDLALDGFPWNGGTTTIETLLAGVPVLTLSGPRPSGRSSRVFLDPLGLEHWAHDDIAAWIEAAVAAAGPGRSALRALRRELPGQVRGSALMNPQDYLPRWEAALTRMLA